MLVESSIDAIRSWTKKQTHGGKTVGLVPTMGALHAGHISLAAASRETCDCTVATIFVNPTQFAPTEDLAKYPRTLQADLAALADAGVDAVFTPNVDEIYRPGFSTFVATPEVAQSLEGRSRPDHFRGVTTIVMKLFHIVPATHAFFGQKDYQQAAVIRAMAADLDVDMEIRVCPIVREDDGLAMSSRNRYLDKDQRQRALCLYKALHQAKRLLGEGVRESNQIESAMRAVLASDADALEYACVVDADTLAPMAQVTRPAVALVAAKVGTTRLIDNMLL